MAGALALLAFRLKLFVIALVIAALLGERLSTITRMDAVAEMVHRFTVTLGKRLNRASRSVATRVYRGMIAAAILIVPAVVTGIFLSTGDSALQSIALVIMIALLGRGLQSHTLFTRWKQAKEGTLSLEAGTILFNDTHGVLRHTIATSADLFAIRVIGSGFWFIIGGVPAMFCYLALSVAAQHYSADREGNEAFGWAVAHVFSAVNVLPRLIFSVLLILAACIVPKTMPVRGIRQFARQPNNARALVAALLGISLESAAGSSATISSWVGAGTAQLATRHLERWILLLLALMTLLMVGLLALTLYK